MRGRPHKDQKVVDLRGKPVPPGKLPSRGNKLKLVPLGAPPADMTREQKNCWAAFKREMPWLCESDRCVMEVVATLRAEFTANGRELTNAKLSHYRQMLSLMGGSPRDRNGVHRLPDDAGEAPPKEYF